MIIFENYTLICVGIFRTRRCFNCISGTTLFNAFSGTSLPLSPPDFSPKIVAQRLRNYDKRAYGNKYMNIICSVFATSTRENNIRGKKKKCIVFFSLGAGEIAPIQFQLHRCSPSCVHRCNIFFRFPIQVSVQ